MVFFLAILALAAVSMLLVRTMGIKETAQPVAVRASRARATRVPASALLDAPSLRGLY